MNKLLQNSVSKNTMNVYETALSSFTSFRTSFQIEDTWPPPLDHLINYIAFLSKKGYSYKTAKSYLSGINYKMKINNWNDYSGSFILGKMLNGMQRLGKHVDSRKPITIDVLKQILPVLRNVCDSYYETIMFSAAFSLSFFGFMRIGEIAYLNKNADHVLQISDISFNNSNSEVFVSIKSSKTDQIGLSTTLILSKNENDEICVIDNLRKYIQLRPKIDGPLFCHLSHNALNRNQFLAVLRAALNFVGLDADEFNTHSFRIGAATTAALAGKTDDEIKSMGRWNSNSFRSYIRIEHIVKF